MRLMNVRCGFEVKIKFSGRENSGFKYAILPTTSQKKLRKVIF